MLAANARESSVIGLWWRGWNEQVYYCDSHDPSIGLWMTNVLLPSDRRNVSPQAISRTFHSGGLAMVKPHAAVQFDEVWCVDATCPTGQFLPRKAAPSDLAGCGWQQPLLLDEFDARRLMTWLVRAHVLLAQSGSEGCARRGV